MIEPSEVFAAVRRGYGELETSSNAEIIDYFNTIDADSVSGHASHIKGIVFEQEYADLLQQQDIQATLFAETNHPVTDLAIWEDGEIVTELQLKATDSVSYIQATIQEHPDVTVVATSEAASHFDTEQIIDAGIEDAALEGAVHEAIFDEALNPVSPFSAIGWLFGIF